MIVLGTKTYTLAQFETVPLKCTNCHETCVHDITVTRKVIRLFWIPTFPLKKKVVAECDNCLHQTKKHNFSAALFDSYAENELQVKNPLWHWIGMIPILLLLLAIGQLESEKRPETVEDVFLEGLKETLSSTPDPAKDSLSFELKKFMDKQKDAPLKDTYTSYTSYAKGDSVLVLVRIRVLKRLDLVKRFYYPQKIQQFLSKKGFSKNKQYLGIYGKVSLKFAITPRETHSGVLVLDKPLLDFFK